MSLPLRECGLKLYKNIKNKGKKNVTPLAGVWIEIFVFDSINCILGSLPLRECGLKSQ